MFLVALWYINNDNKSYRVVVDKLLMLSCFPYISNDKYYVIWTDCTASCSMHSCTELRNVYIIRLNSASVRVSASVTGSDFVTHSTSVTG